MQQADDGVADAVTRARNIAPRIVECADEIDRGRRLPQDLVDELIAQGLFRLLVPRSFGGEEMDWLAYLDVVRIIAEADGSTGWCLNQGAVFATTSARCPESLAREVWGNPCTVVANGPPQGAQSVPVADGYRLTGNWMFSSGCRHANWIAAVAANKGEPARLHLLPKSEVEFVDVWQVDGLRGTGSFGFRTNDLFVPNEHAIIVDVPPLEPGPLYVVPQHLMFAAGFGCVALGVARAGLDAAIELANGKRPRFGRRSLAEEPVIHSQVGKAQATWAAAKALLYETVADVWDSVQTDLAITVEQRIRLRMAGTHAIRQSADVVDSAYNLCGSDAIFASRAIQRRFQDAHVITQQVQGRESHYETAGQFFLGLEPTGPLV